MRRTDMNLLVALDALLQEQNVGAAAEKLGLSSPAMSRTLARIREAVGDEILVRAGRRMVPTERALSLRLPVRKVLEMSVELLQPQTSLDLRNIERSFTIRSNDGFLASFGVALTRAIENLAPGVQVCFAPEGEEDIDPLRERNIDLDISVLGDAGPEVRIQKLFEHNFVGVVRRGHSLCEGTITPARYAAESHVSYSRRGKSFGPIDQQLSELSLTRRVPVVVSTIGAALDLASASDLVANVPRLSIGTARDLHVFNLPVTTKPVSLSMMWHPRLEADPAHKWLRETVRHTCANEIRRRDPKCSSDKIVRET